METRRVRLSPAEVDRLADEISELSAQIDAASHRFLALIRRFDESSGWAEHGALTCAHWLSWRVGLDLGAAREHVRVARALAPLPLIDDALRRGQLSYSKVRALTRIATPENEVTLLMWARSATASQLERICRKYRMVQSLRADTPEEETKTRYVRVREMDTGFVRIEVQLPPEEAAVVLKALDAASRRAKGAEESTPAQSHDVSAETPEPDGICPEVSASGDVSAETPPGTGRVPPEPMRYPDRLRARASRADALIAVAEAYLAGSSVASRTPPVEVVVHVERGLEGAALDDGTRLSAETGARLACDASIVRVVEDAHGNPLDIGRRSRTIPPAMKRALLLRDRSCRFPGCTNRLVDGHHVVPWSQGGATRLANLVSLCRRHHRFVHEGGVSHRKGGRRRGRVPRPERHAARTGLHAAGRGRRRRASPPADALCSRHPDRRQERTSAAYRSGRLRSRGAGAPRAEFLRPRRGRPLTRTERGSSISVDSAGIDAKARALAQEVGRSISNRSHLGLVSSKIEDRRFPSSHDQLTITEQE